MLSGACSFSWMDEGTFPTFRDPIQASTIAVYPEMEEAVGANLRVYGYDENGKWIMTADSNGVLQDGFLTFLLFMDWAQVLPQISSLRELLESVKPVTNGFIQIVALDPGASSGGTLLGLICPILQSLNSKD